MIRLSVTLLTCSLLFACNSTNPKPSKPIVLNVDFKKVDTVVPFAGFWLNEKYAKEIVQTKSPRDCEDVPETCLWIPARTLQPSSISTDLHEGGVEMVLVKKDNTFQLYNKDGDTITNFAYEIEVINPEKLKIGKNTFIKTDENFLADILFSGDYQDSLKNTVQFLKDGHIKGLGAYTLCKPLYDYMGPGMEVNLVNLGPTQEKLEDFGFKFIKDTLFIHNLNCLQRDSTDNSCLEVSLGDVKYKLIKKH